jgi:PPK2 family polyphosphate:nucleotide phosphotransferase
VLLVLQGIDASGKDGTIRRVFTGLNPQGCSVTSFRAPAGVETEHHYLWRIEQALPRFGEIGIFNRSHYEDVVTTVVLGLIDNRVRKRRCRQIKEFERTLTEEGTTIVKVFLHVSKDEQGRRLRERLEDPEKRWKFRADDLETRARWDEHMTLYEAAISETSTAHAPWYVVPADRKWASGLAVATILVDTISEMDPKLPTPDPALEGVVVE